MKRKYIDSTMLALLLALFGAGAIAQTQPMDAIKEKLAKPVALTQGLTTVNDFVQELSKQTGIPIRAENYLKEHRLSVCMSGISAKSALKSMCEMQHWRWIVSKGPEILVTHRLTVFPKNLSEYPRAYRAVFPVAWLPYLGEGVDPDRAITEQQRKSMEENVRGLHSGSYIAPDQVDAELTTMIRSSDILYAMKKRLEGGSYDDDLRLTLFPTVRADFKVGTRIPYSKWTEEERNSTLRLIMAKFIYSQISSLMKAEIMLGDVRWFIANPELGAVATREGSLLLGATFKDKDGNTTESMVGERIYEPVKKKN